MDVLMKSRLPLAGLLLSFVSLGAPNPPAVGDKAPDFALRRASNGSEIRLSDVNATTRVALIILRGYPGYQCPFCNRQVHDLIRNAKQLQGLRVILVFPGTGADLEVKAKEFMADKPLPPGFELLTDPDYRVTNLYGLRWDKPGETAYPSTFVLEPGGKVKFAKISHSHGDRTTAAEVAAAAQK